MNFRILLDECHNNNLDFLNSETLQLVLNRLEGVVFRLVQPPITYENIKGEDLIIIGCPTTKYTPSEIDSLERFVQNGKGMVIVSGNGGDLFYNTNLNEIGRIFEFEFNDDQVEDEINNQGLSNVVNILNFETIDSIHFSENVKSIIYSGCSMNILDESCKPIAKSNPSSTPHNVPVAVISGNKRVVGIGAFNLFIDHPEFGIERAQNLQFVLTMFDYLKNHINLEGEKVSIEKSQETIEEEVQEPIEEVMNQEILGDIDQGTLEELDLEVIEEYFNVEDFEAWDVEVVEPEIDVDKIAPKNAIQKFDQISDYYIEKLNEIADKYDEFWLAIKNKIVKSLKREVITNLKGHISTTHKKFFDNINKLAAKINDIFSLFCSTFSQQYFNYDTALTNWFEQEAECREKLDMIRNNLLAALDSMMEEH